MTIFGNFWQFWTMLDNFGQSLANGPIVPSLFIIVIQTKAYCTAKLSCNKDSTVCNQKMHISSQWKLFEIFHPASLTYVTSNSASTFSMFYKKHITCWMIINMKVNNYFTLLHLQMSKVYSAGTFSMFCKKKTGVEFLTFWM